MALAAPKNPRWDRLSDQDVTIKWDKVTGATKYQIAMQTGGAANAVKDTGWTPTGTSFTARRFRVNSGFRFAIRAWDNKGNAGPWSDFTPWFYTPPPKVNMPSVKVTAEGLLVSWSRAGTYYTQGAEVQVEGGATTVLGNGTVGAAPTSVLLAVMGLGVRVRVRGFVGASGAQSRVFGAWSDWSAPVNALTAPNAPLLVSPTGFAPSWAATVFEWKHQPTDSTAQTGAEVRYRQDGGAWTTKTVTTAQTLSVASLAVGSYEYQVRTKGLSGVFGDWSPVAVFVAITRPVVAVTTPDKTLSRLTAKWSWTQAEGLPQSNVIVTLLQGGDIVEQRRGTGPATSTVFDVVLKNATAYQLRVEAACSGLYAAAKTVSWTTEFVGPATPTISAVWKETSGYHEITVAPGVGGTKPAVSMDVHRDSGDGWELVAEGLTPTQHVLADYLGVTYGDNTYRVTAWASDGGTTSAEVTVQTRSDYMWVSWENENVAIMYNSSTTYAPKKHDASLVYFDGEEKPVLIEGEGVSRVATVTGTLIPEWMAEDGEVTARQAREKLEEWVVGPGILPTLSTPERLVITGKLDAQFSADTGGLPQVQLTIEEAR